VPGAIPGLPGLAAFAGIKFGGYVLAVTALRKLQPAITASALKIAAARTGLGILLGQPVTIAAIAIVEHFSTPTNEDSSPLPILYAFLFALRILIWALVIFVFTKQVLGLCVCRGALVLSARFAGIRLGANVSGPDSDLLVAPFRTKNINEDSRF